MTSAITYIDTLSDLSIFCERRHKFKSECRSACKNACTIHFSVAGTHEVRNIVCAGCEGLEWIHEL